MIYFYYYFDFCFFCKKIAALAISAEVFAVCISPIEDAADDDSDDDAIDAYGVFRSYLARELNIMWIKLLGMCA